MSRVKDLELSLTFSTSLFVFCWCVVCAGCVTGCRGCIVCAECAAGCRGCIVCAGCCVEVYVGCWVAGYVRCFLGLCVGCVAGCVEGCVGSTEVCIEVISATVVDLIMLSDEKLLSLSLLSITTCSASCNSWLPAPQLAVCCCSSSCSSTRVG